MRAADDAAPPAPVAALAARLAGREGDGVPLLVVRVPALERTAWRDGRRAARRLERRVATAFSSAVARVLRAGDRIAHDPGSDAFLAALLAPTRDGQTELTPVDVRSALARIAATVETRTQLEVDAGWTRVDAADGGLDVAIGRALVRGARERERYAFFSAVGHELRTPLASIRGYLETLLGDEPDPALRRRFVEIAYNESLRLGRLLEGMFEMSLLDLSATFAAPQRAPVGASLGAVADACAANARARAVRLHVPPAAPGVAAIDPDRLTLVLINLVDNAIKHGRQGGRVAVSVAAAARSIRVAVEDDGPGIAAADRERIFALGQRGATASAGTGIGLALVRLMLERAGGRVDLEEAPGGGARFVVVLPRAPEA